MQTHISAHTVHSSPRKYDLTKKVYSSSFASKTRLDILCAVTTSKVLGRPSSIGAQRGFVNKGYGHQGIRGTKPAGESRIQETNVTKRSQNGEMGVMNTRWNPTRSLESTRTAAAAVTSSGGVVNLARQLLALLGTAGYAS